MSVKWMWVGRAYILNIIFISVILLGFFLWGEEVAERGYNEGFISILRKISENVARSVDTSVCPLPICEMEIMIISFFIIYCQLSSLTDYEVLFVNPVPI